MAIETIDKKVEKERFTVYLPSSTALLVRQAAAGRMRYSKLVNDAILAYLAGEFHSEIR